MKSNKLIAALLTIALCIAAGTSYAVEQKVQNVAQIVQDYSETTETVIDEQIPAEEETTPQIAKYKAAGEFVITAYCACEKCCGQYANGITATGTTATEGRTIAADPTVLPYGTKVLIDGREYVVEDCGGAIKNNRIDLYFDSHSEALQFGVQKKEVYVK